jgi:hypothetical protein
MTGCLTMPLQADRGFAGRVEDAQCTSAAAAERQR